MAMSDRERREESGGIVGFDRRLLAAAMALGFLTLLAVLDPHRPVPGSEPPVEVRIPVIDPPLAMVPATRRPVDPDNLLAYD